MLVKKTKGIDSQMQKKHKKTECWNYIQELKIENFFYWVDGSITTGGGI